MRQSRRQFLGGLVRGAGGAGLLLAGGCGDNVFLNDSRVDDRFNE